MTTTTRIDAMDDDGYKRTITVNTIPTVTTLITLETQHRHITEQLNAHMTDLTNYIEERDCTCTNTHKAPFGKKADITMRIPNAMGELNNKLCLICGGMAI